MTQSWTRSGAVVKTKPDTNYPVKPSSAEKCVSFSYLPFTLTCNMSTVDSRPWMVLEGWDRATKVILFMLVESVWK